MSALHTISVSPTSGLLNSCLRLVCPGDGILLFRTVYHCCPPCLLDSVSQDNALFGLREDLLAARLLGKISKRITPVGFDRYVELAVDYDKVISWS